jgi:hypothetical protein
LEKLCQRGAASCGACCGLYNRHDLSRSSVRLALHRRTEALAGIPRTRESFDAAAELLGRGEAAPFLGFLDEAETRVGCLAHPLSTGGVDLRDCGVYDARVCETFFCPSHSWFSEDEAVLVSEVCAGDPYLYGLVITDVPFVRAALAGLSLLVGRSVGPRDLGTARFRTALHRVFALKEELAPGSDGLFGAFEAGDEGDPLPRSIDYAALGRAQSSPYDELLRCIGADPRSGNDLDALEDEVRRRLEACASTLG